MYFCLTNKCKSGENAKYSQRAPGGGTGNYTFQGFFSKPSRTTGVEILGISKQYEDEAVNIF